MKTSLTNDLRIIWAITAKDLVDAFKNKNVLGVVIPALFVIVLYRFMPAIMVDDHPPALLVYDVGNPALMTLLEDSPAVSLFEYESEDQMLNYLSNGEQPELGLIIPAGFDQSVSTEQSLTLQGYMLHFFTAEQEADIRNYIQDELEYLLDKPVNIQIQRVQLQAEAHGITILASMGFSFTLIMVGMIAVPHMILEEKQSKTLDAILVSPANSTHFIAAKALTGLIYSLIVYGIGLLIFQFIIVHWGLALIAGLLGALFAVSLGLLLGILVDNRQQLTLYAWVGLIPIFMPLIFSIMDDLLPDWLIQIIRLVPSAALMRAIRSSMLGNPPLKYVLPQLLNLLISAGLILVLDIWFVRQKDR